MNLHHHLQHTLRAGALLSAAWAGLASLTAQTVEPEKDKAAGPDPVVVLNPYVVQGGPVKRWNSQMTFSGSRTAENLLEVPINISILTSDYLRDLGATNALGIFQFAASGVTNRVAYRDDYTIRSFRQSKSVDGLTGGGAGFTSGYSPLFDVERVEVVKGPTALVFSNFGNVSGTINYVIKRPTSMPTGDATVSIGSFGHYSADATQRGPLTADGSLRYRVTVGAFNNDGWHGHGTDANSYSNARMASASLDWSAARNLELRFDASYNYMAQRDFQENFIDPATQKLWERSLDGVTLSTNWAKTHSTEKRVRAEAIYTLNPNLTVRALVNFYKSNLEINYPFAATGLVLSEAPVYRTFKDIYQQLYFNPAEFTDTVVDLTWKRELAKDVTNRLNLGWQYNQTDSKVTQTYPTLPDILIDGPISGRPAPIAFSSLPAPTPDFTINGGWTAYLQDSVTLLNGKLIGVAGARYVSGSATRQGKTATVPNIGAIYRLRPTVSLYAQYAESFRPQVGVDDFGTPRKDIVGKSAEGGVKFNAFNERLFGTLTYFDIMVDPVNRLVTRPDPVTGIPRRGTAQVGRETNAGFEAEFGWVQPGVAGIWSSYVTAYNASPKTVEGAQPSSAIKEKYTFFTKYQLNVGQLKGVYFGGGISYTGGSPGTGFAFMPAYTMASLLLGYNTENWRMSCNIDNVADKRDAIIGSEGPNSVYLANPRAFKVSVTRTW
ncbi:MAG: TonB-dependent receptor [Opitutaceae bacterium]|nr:TonB-dependent receptor [Opitutaceae bacterium]